MWITKKFIWADLNFWRKRSTDLYRNQAYETFVEKNKKWLEDYSLYMAIKNSLGGIAWSEWEAPLKTRQEAALEEKTSGIKRTDGFYLFSAV